MADVTMAMPDAHSLGDAWARRIADGTARHGADRTGNHGAGERPQGCVADPFLRPGSGRNQGHSAGKSEDAQGFPSAHRFPPRKLKTVG
jgi:hypothetical protein